MNKLIVHIGLHKTGSTWLQKMFFEADENFHLLNDFKKPWEDELCKAIIESKDHIEAKNIIDERSNPRKINIISAERLSGHPISGGYDMENIANTLRKTTEDIRIILVRREPHSFVKSCYVQLVREGYTGSLEQFLFGSHWKTIGPSRSYFEQEKIVDYYENLFGKDNLLILEFEEFKINKAQFIEKLNRFIGSNVVMNENDYQLNVGKADSNRTTRALRSMNRMRRTEYNPNPLISLGNRMARRMSRMISVFYSNREIDSDQLITDYLKKN